MKTPHDVRLLDKNGFNSALQDANVVFGDFDGDGTADIGVTHTSREDYIVRAPKPFAPGLGATFEVSYSSRLTRRRVTRMCSQCAQSGYGNQVT